MVREGVAPAPSIDRLHAFLDHLRSRGFGVSIPEYTLAQDLLVLATAAGSTNVASGFAGLLGPVVCRSAEEQAEFHRLFEAWFAAPPTTAERAAPERRRVALTPIARHAAFATVAVILGTNVYYRALIAATAMFDTTPYLFRSSDPLIGSTDATAVLLWAWGFLSLLSVVLAPLGIRLPLEWRSSGRGAAIGLLGAATFTLLLILIDVVIAVLPVPTNVAAPSTIALYVILARHASPLLPIALGSVSFRWAGQFLVLAACLVCGAFAGDLLLGGVDSARVSLIVVAPILVLVLRASEREGVTSRPDRRSWRYAAVLLGVLTAVATRSDVPGIKAGFVYRYDPTMESFTRTKAVPFGPELEEPSAPALPTDTPPAPTETPQPVEVPDDSTIWLRLLLSAAPLLLVAQSFVATRLRTAVLTRRATSGGRELRRLVVPDQAMPLYGDNAMQRAARAMRKPLVSGDLELHLDHTIRRTVAAGGLFSPAHRPRVQTPEYLFLVDRRGARDHLAHLVDAFVSRLRREGVHVDRHFFDRDPRQHDPDARGVRRAFGDLLGAGPTRLLVLAGDGAALCDPITRKPHPWTQAFERFGARLLVTFPSAGAQTRVARTVERDLSFVALSGTREGLQKIGSVATAATPHASGDASSAGAATFPALLLEGTARWTSPVSPPDGEVDVLLAELRRYLGEDGFVLLQACAAYPELHWNLTLALGGSLLRSFGVRQEDTLLRLSSLPWFRGGALPDWLRTQLLTSLPKPKLAALRDTLRGLLLRSAAGTRSAFALAIGVSDRFRLWRQVRSLLLARSKPGPLHDATFLDVVFGRPRRLLDLVVPEALTDRLGFAREWLAQGWVKMAIACALSLLIWNLQVQPTPPPPTPLSEVVPNEPAEPPTTLPIAALPIEPAKPPTPAPTEINRAVVDRIVQFYRKKNNVPRSLDVRVTGIRDSPITGAKEGTLQVGSEGSAKMVGFTVSPDGRYVYFGDAEDLSVDPSKALMQKIKLDDTPCRGPKNAKVTIVEYSDFQCPFCKRAYDTIEQKVLKQYGNQVRFCFKDYPLPFHPWAEPAAIAAECARAQKADAYWKIYDGFYQNQGEVSPTNVTEKAWSYVEADKLDRAKFDDCYDNKKTEAAVRADMAEGAQVGVTGTPAFFINGRMLVGAQPFEKFKDVIDDELASAG